MNVFKYLYRLSPAGTTLAVVLGCAILVAGCGRRVPQQSEALDEKSKIILVDAWILEHTPELLQAKFCYEGVDPNRTYNLRASLSTDKKAFEMGGGWRKQIPIPSAGSPNRHEVIWEFGWFPRNTPNIFLRLDFTDKETGLARTVDFKIPGTQHLRSRKMGSQ